MGASVSTDVCTGEAHVGVPGADDYGSAALTGDE